MKLEIAYVKAILEKTSVDINTIGVHLSNLDKQLAVLKDETKKLQDNRENSSSRKEELVEFSKVLDVIVKNLGQQGEAKDDRIYFVNQAGASILIRELMSDEQIEAVKKAGRMVHSISDVTMEKCPSCQTLQPFIKTFRNDLYEPEIYEITSILCFKCLKVTAISYQ